MASAESSRDRVELRRSLRVVERRSVLKAKALSVETAERAILRDVDLRIAHGEVCGVIGPSGVGKSTLLRSLNRLIDLDEELTVSGRVEYLGRSIYDPRVDVDELRSRIGSIFQQPVVFPGMIADNVAFGVRRLRRLPRRQLAARVETALKKAALWDEVKDRLREPAEPLSVGQRQRLCLARALAVEPDVLLMDEPTSALDPAATDAIETLVAELKRELTVVLVTHDLGQARRVADQVACFGLREGAGELVEHGLAADVFNAPQSKEVAEFLDRRYTS